jgi:hypothetical protein
MDWAIPFLTGAQCLQLPRGRNDGIAVTRQRMTRQPQNSRLIVGNKDDAALEQGHDWKCSRSGPGMVRKRVWPRDHITHKSFEQWAFKHARCALPTTRQHQSGDAIGVAVLRSKTKTRPGGGNGGRAQVVRIDRRVSC